ncbi:MAG TPA: PIG-L family deacetylase [Syntrophales bacterium]|nr:PIG-L family deacetylase [Syntrophales bacterium]HNS53555.1 PIG-L family deacetylase [Syntrophales bacterium]HQL89369.1 PIG-L family deacetylase [Syntrophales bacterium]
MKKEQKRVLAFGTHPDDIEIGCGGTVALLALQGCEITHVILTSGEAGSDRLPPWEVGPVREKEALEAAKILGAANVEFLRRPDGLTGFSREMKLDIIRVVRRLRPHILFVHERNETSLGHRVASELVLEALRAGSGPWFQEAGGEPWSPELVLGYEVWHPLGRWELAVDISATLETKIRALACHRSQTAAVRYDEAVRGLARWRGVMSLAGGDAEVFEVIQVSQGALSCFSR